MDCLFAYNTYCILSNFLGKLGSVQYVVGTHSYIHLNTVTGRLLNWQLSKNAKKCIYIQPTKNTKKLMYGNSSCSTIESSYNLWKLNDNPKGVYYNEKLQIKIKCHLFHYSYRFTTIIHEVLQALQLNKQTSQLLCIFKYSKTVFIKWY